MSALTGKKHTSFLANYCFLGAEILTLVVKFGTVWTEAFVVVPVGVPTLPWRDATTFTPDTCHTHL